MIEAKMYGWYSAKAAERCGIVEYETPDGKTVLVTTVTHEPEGVGYMWDDKKPVGEVTRFVRTVKESDYLWMTKESWPQRLDFGGRL